MNWTYKILNIVFHLFHLSIIFISVLGCLFQQYLGYYIIFQSLIICSWIAYGLYDARWGCCVVTELQWAIKSKHNKRPETASYVQYLLKYKMGFQSGEKTVAIMIVVVFFFTYLLGIARYIFDF